MGADRKCRVYFAYEMQVLLLFSHKSLPVKPVIYRGYALPRCLYKCHRGIKAGQSFSTSETATEVVTATSKRLNKLKEEGTARQDCYVLIKKISVGTNTEMFWIFHSS